MKLTKSILKQIIKEEISNILNEGQGAASIIAGFALGGREAAIEALKKTGVLDCLKATRSTRGLADSLPRNQAELKKWLAMLPDECRRLLK